MALNVTLVVVGGDVKTPEVKLRLPSTVGRGRDCSIMLRHPLVSRQHCEIFEAGGALLVRDLGSLNGTFVNNQRIEGDAPLQPGQLLTIGTVTFRAMYDADDVDAGPPDTPAPQMRSSRAANANETDHDGAMPARGSKASDATVRSIPADAATEPVDVDADFDLDDAKPLFSEAPPPKAAGDVARKNGAGGQETVYSPNKTKPAGASPPKPAAAPPPPKPAEPVSAAPAKAGTAPAKPAAAPAKPEAPAPSFEFMDADESGGEAADDDDLNDFLKNLK